MSVRGNRFGLRLAALTGKGLYSLALARRGSRYRAFVPCVDMLRRFLADGDFPLLVEREIVAARRFGARIEGIAAGVSAYLEFSAAAAAAVEPQAEIDRVSLIVYERNAF